MTDRSVLCLALCLANCGGTALTPEAPLPREVATEAPESEPEPALAAPLPPHAHVRGPIAFAADYSLCVALGRETFCWPGSRMAAVPSEQPEWPRRLDLAQAPLRIAIEARCLMPGAIVGEETTLRWYDLAEAPSRGPTEVDAECLLRLDAESLRAVAQGPVTSIPELAGGRFAVVDGVPWFRERWNRDWEAIPGVADAIEITASPVCVRTTAGALRCWNRVLQTSTVETPDALRQGLVETISLDERVVDLTAESALCFVTEGGRAGCLCHELTALACEEAQDLVWVPDVEGARHIQLAAQRLCVLTDERLVCYQAGRRTEARLDTLAERSESLTLPPPL